jgi:5'-3' exonuclease
MMTPDKDFGQLVTEHIKMYRPATFGGSAEVLGVPEILKKFEIKNVSQVTDILGLWGDSADNIPGIPGVGEKTAKQLIAEYDTVENIIKNADKLKGKLADKVKEHAKLALLSKQLATIITDVPVKFDEKALAVEAPTRINYARYSRSWNSAHLPNGCWKKILRSRPHLLRVKAIFSDQTVMQLQLGMRRKKLPKNLPPKISAILPINII